MNDIQEFLEKRGAVLKEDDEEEVSSSDDTLRDEGDENQVEDADDINGRAEKGVDIPIQQQNHRVRFQDHEEMDFSPPRMPKNSPSYLIWSIFTKEREEREKQKLKKQSGQVSSRKAPLSQVPMRSASDLVSDVCFWSYLFVVY